MKLKTPFSLMALMLCVFMVSYAQDLDLSLVAIDTEQTDQKCYAISLKANDEDIALAGQNYRLYYNGEQARFIEQSLTSLLPSSYTEAVLVNEVHDVDAYAFGNLNFDKHLSFINFYIDLEQTDLSGTVRIGKSPMQVATFCFDATEQVEMSYAQKGITDEYATAFVEIAHVIADNKATKASIELINASINTSINESEVYIDLARVYPNPFEQQFTLAIPMASSGNLSVTIVNIYGAVIYSDVVSGNDTTLSIDLSTQPAGTYVVQILDGHGQVIQNIKATKII